MTEPDIGECQGLTRSINYSLLLLSYPVPLLDYLARVASGNLNRGAVTIIQNSDVSLKLLTWRKTPVDAIFLANEIVQSTGLRPRTIR